MFSVCELKLYYKHKYHVALCTDALQLPPKPSEPSQGTQSSAPPAGAYNPYSPAVAVSATGQQAQAPPAPLNIGFENMSSMFVFCDVQLPVHLPGY